MFNQTIKTYSLYLFPLLIFITVGTACNVSNSHSNSKPKTFARTVSITYHGQKVNAITTAMAADGEGGAVITGNLEPKNLAVPLIFIAHIGNQGTLLWQKIYGDDKYSNYPDYAHDIIQTNDGNYVITGMIGQHLWLLKINIQGKILWQQKYYRVEVPATNSTAEYHSSDEGYSLIQTLDGGFAVAGRTTVRGISDHPEPTPSLLRVDSTGKKLWVKQYINGVGNVIHAVAISQGSGGNFLLSLSAPYVSSPVFYTTEKGKFSGLGFTRRNSSMRFYNDIIKLKNGSGFVMSGGGNGNAYPITVTKVGGIGGKVIWSHQYGMGTVHALTETGDGNIVVAGSLIEKVFEGYKQHGYFFELDAKGDVLWKKELDLRRQTVLHGVYETNDGGFILAGIAADTYHPAGVFGHTSGSEPLIIRTDSLGHISHIEKDLQPPSEK
jgi:hypothetical protein